MAILSSTDGRIENGIDGLSDFNFLTDRRIENGIDGLDFNFQFLIFNQFLCYHIPSDLCDSLVITWITH